jgi:ATP-dependent DNA helicase RecG
MRPEILFGLFADVTALKGVGAALAKTLARLELARVIDLLFHLPTGRIERVPLTALDQGAVGRTVILTVMVEGIDKARAKGSPTRINCHDATGRPLTLTYFGGEGDWLPRQFPVGVERTVSGVVELYGGRLQIVHPDYAVVPSQAGTIPLSEPVYPLTEGLTNKRLGGLMRLALERAPELPEWSDAAMVSRKGWAAWRQALAGAHDGHALARERLAYDELLANQLALGLIRASTRKRPGRAIRPLGGLKRQVMAQLPFQPTTAQARSVAEIEADLA